MQEKGTPMVEGFLKVFYPDTGEIIEEKCNAIHFENFSEALAQSLANKNKGYIYTMAFGNGGTNVDPTGVITYLPANTVGQSADLYNETYSKVVDDNSTTNTDIGFLWVVVTIIMFWNFDDNQYDLYDVIYQSLVPKVLQSSSLIQ